MQKLIDKFIAKGNDGKDYIINIYVNLIDVGTHDDDPNAKIEGKIKSLRTEDGLHVTRVDKGVYWIEKTGLRLHSDSPDAP
jgi:hypothetical protein